MTRMKIPKFKNYQEEALFWDTHDVSDYLDEMKFSDVAFLPKQKKVDSVTIRLEPKFKDKLGKIAGSYGLNISSLSRMWLIDRLKQT